MGGVKMTTVEKQAWEVVKTRPVQQSVLCNQMVIIEIPTLFLL